MFVKHYDKICKTNKSKIQLNEFSQKTESLSFEKLTLFLLLLNNILP